MTGAPREPLTPEERELSDRLARLGPPAGPSPALDARILAAARAAVAPSHGRRARRPHWPVALGVAATLALAIGVAWQLRPAQETARAYSEAPVAASARRGPGPSAGEDLPMTDMAAETAADAPPPLAAPVPPPPEPDGITGANAGARADAAPRRTPAPAPAAPDVGAAEREEAAALPQRDQASAEPRRAAVRSTPPAPAPQDPAADMVFEVAPPASPPSVAPATPAAAEGATASMPARTRVDAAKRLESAPAQEAEAPGDAEAAAIAIERDNAGFTDQALDDQPPATADSPEVQRAWLQRIRELLARGDAAGARASLAEFKRRYPRYALPDDLREFAP